MIDDFECMSETSNKLKKFLDSRKIFKNWLLYFIIYFKLSKSDSEIFETRSGLKMKIRVNSTDLMQLTTIWVDKEYAIPGFEINENDIIIDIGGHVGLFIVFCKQFCNNGKIFCFEPVKENYEQCMENIRINNLQNVNLFNMAVTKKTGEIPIYLNEDDSGHSIFLKDKKSIKVKSISLEDILLSNKIQHCDLLKIDCEGAEYEIIESIPEHYFENIDKIIIEYHFAKDNPQLFENLIKKLKMVSYSLTIKKMNDSMGLIYACK